jgi:hypothetical protein
MEKLVAARPFLAKKLSMIRSYKVYLTNEKKLAPSSIIIAVSVLRFLYKITLRKDSVHFA